MSGTLAGTGAGFEVDLITVEDGLVKSKDSYIDAVSMQAQLGWSGRLSTESFWRTA